MRGPKAVCGLEGSHQSTSASVNRGVRQGSVLSPTLFLLVINSLAIGVSIPVRPWPEHIWTLSWVFRTYR